MRHPALIPLSHDHHHALALALRCRKQALGQLKPLGKAGLCERAREARNFFSLHLAAHFHAEEAALFPMIESLGAEQGPLIDRLKHEHERLRSLVDAMEASDGLGKVLFEFGDLLESHVRREERELFALFEARIEEAEADAIGRRIKALLAGHG
ncbi:MAG TPA: hemerythrin domain-containing protein [Candidatus Eisenbacteria bacterium]|nr:hemerythrin domain-containing protein [Candidatus Eisenbacteria bacterium]